MRRVVVGIDIGGTNTAIGVVDSEGRILAERGISTAKHSRFEDYIAEMAETTQSLLEGDMQLGGIGIGAPDACYHTGTIENAHNLNWSGSLPLVATLQEYFPEVLIVMTNDANAATLGEMVYGDAKGLNDFMMITLGTGVGSGFVANGKLIYGFDGFAGEAGHIIVETDGRPCGCGRRGCLESYCSATGIVTTAHALLEESEAESALRTGEVTSLRLFEQAQLGDAIAIECFKLTGEILGRALADMVTITAPRKIFIFGGLAKAGDMLLNYVRESFNNSVMSVWRDKIEILPSGLEDDNIAILGAASLVS